MTGSTQGEPLGLPRKGKIIPRATKWASNHNWYRRGNPKSKEKK